MNLLPSQGNANCCHDARMHHTSHKTRSRVFNSAPSRQRPGTPLPAKPAVGPYIPRKPIIAASH
eukprot:3830004-Amphidinium_carterae.1